MSKTEELSERLAILEKAAAEIRSLLTKKSGNIMDRIKTMEDVYEEAGISPATVLLYTNPENKYQKGVNAFAKVSLICQVLNEGWEPNWKDSNEYKYYPWFDMRKAAGSGFSGSLYADGRASTGVGSQLCYKSAELAKYAGDQFEAEYFEYMNK